jgi:DUF2075 family protein
LKERKISFLKDVKYLGVIFGRKITWRIHTDSITTFKGTSEITPFEK